MTSESLEPPFTVVRQRLQAVADIDMSTGFLGSWPLNQMPLGCKLPKTTTFLAVDPTIISQSSALLNAHEV